MDQEEKDHKEINKEETDLEETDLEETDLEEIVQENIDKILKVFLRTLFIGIGFFLFKDLSQIQLISCISAVNSIGTWIFSLILSIIILEFTQLGNIFPKKDRA